MQREMKITNFDLDIQKPLKKLIEIAEKRFPNRTWYMEVMYWQDSDYQITLVSTWGNHKYEFSYKKSINKYNYLKYLFREKTAVESKVLE